MRGFLALGLGVLFAAGVAGGGDAKSELAKLQGKWVGEVKKEGKVELVIAKDTIKIIIEGRELFKGTFKLDPSKKPREMDLTMTEGGKTATALAIYEVAGDTLKWCANEPGLKGRPPEFKSEGKPYLNVTFQRVK